MNIKYKTGIAESSVLKEDNLVHLPVTYHAVITSLNKERLFIDKRVCNNLAYILFEAVVLHKYGLFAFCIMPDHVHILCRPGNVALKHFIDLVKLRFEFVHKKSVFKTAVWEAAFRQDILTDEQIVPMAVFILENPIRSGMADSVIDYPFSFAYGGKPYCP
jgi:putative transposase